MLVLVAFAFKEVDAAAAEFSALFAAAGLGYFIAAFITPVLDRYMSEEPMVVAGLAVEAGAAFIAAQVFGLPAASILALAAEPRSMLCRVLTLSACLPASSASPANCSGARVLVIW